MRLVLVGCLLACGSAALAAQNRAPAPGNLIVLDGSGRTLSAPAVVNSGTAIRVRIPTRTIRLCGSTFTPGGYELRYVGSATLAVPHVLDKTALTIPYDEGIGGFDIPAQKDQRFVVYNVVQRAAVGQVSAQQNCRTQIDDANTRLTDARTRVESAERLVTSAEGDLAAARERLASEQRDAAAYSGIDNAADPLTRLIERIDTTRAAVARADVTLRDRQTEREAARRALAAAPGDIADDLGAPLERARYLLAASASGQVLKIGGVPLGARHPTIYYDFSSRAVASTLHLMPLGAYPVVRYGDDVIAVITNVNRATHPYGFQMTFAVQAGAPVNTDPARPTFPGEGVAVAAGDEPVSAQALTDVLLPLTGAFAPNSVAEVTITTERPSDDDPETLTPATLVDKATYPQYRALYRYNFTSGVFHTSLRPAQYDKVRTIDDDPATDTEDEARYRVDRHEGDPTVMPVFAFSVYPRPVDVQRPVSYERWIPAPTIGFAFVNPADNVYVGFSHEVVRNTQLFWGWHWGVQQELVERNAVSEDRDSTAIVTRDRRERAFAVGLTFNIAVVSKIFH